MNERPKLSKDLDSNTFKNYYYLKEELVDFCKNNGLQATGSKIDITNRIIHYLDTGEKINDIYQHKKNNIVTIITLDTIIEENFICSEKHRAFYKEQIGKSFSFNVLFQKWLKSNAGKTYADSIDAYFQILEDKKKNKKDIDKQFEYNTYIRDFFSDNKDKKLEQAIKCWKYKKSLPGHNKYEQTDLDILDKKNGENMNDSKILIANLDKVHTTEMGIDRIKKNLSLDVEDVVAWCKDKINDPKCLIMRKGKNWYASIDSCVITVNAYSYTIITAHKQKKKD